MSGAVIDEGAPDWPEWLSDHHDLLAFLRRQGVVVGLDREIRVLEVLDQVRRCRIGLGSVGDVVRWMGPVLCTSAVEQARLSELVTRYAEQNSPAACPAPEDVRTRAAQIIARQGRRSVGAFYAAVLTAVMAGLIALAFYVAWDRDPAPKDIGKRLEPTTPTEVVVEAVERNRVSLIRSSGVVFILLATGAVLFWWRGRRIALSRRLLGEEQDGALIDFSDTVLSLFPPIRYRRIVRMIAAHRQVPSTRIDTRETIRATIANGGRVQLRYGRRATLPEHLFIVERTTSHDHQGLLGDLIAERFQLGGVHLTRYDFDQDPRMLRQPRQDGGERYESLFDVAGRFHGQRAIIISDASRFIGIDGRPYRWVETAFQGFSPVALLTLPPVSAWGWNEAELNRAGFHIFPADGEGLSALAAELANRDPTKDPPALLTGRPGIDLAGRLDRERERWLSDAVPDTAVVRDLMTSLRAWLGQDGFTVLAGAALFPELQGDVTLALGEHLGLRHADDDRFTDILVMLARLPWLRAGRMPDWLRSALLAALPPVAAARIRDAYGAILAKAHAGEEGKGTRIVGVQSSLSSGWRDLMGGAAPGETRERIAWDFLRGRGVELEVPSTLQRLLRPRFDRMEWGILAVGAALALFVALVGTSVWNGLTAAFEDIVPRVNVGRLQVVGVLLMLISLALSMMRAAGMPLALRLHARMLLAFPVLLFVMASILAGNGSDYGAIRLLFAGAVALSVAMTLGQGPVSLRPPATSRTLADLFRHDVWWVTTLVLFIPIGVFMLTSPLMVPIWTTTEEEIITVSVPTTILHLMAVLGIVTLAGRRLTLRWFHVLGLATGMLIPLVVVYILVQHINNAQNFLNESRISLLPVVGSEFPKTVNFILLITPTLQIVCLFISLWYLRLFFINRIFLIGVSVVIFFCACLSLFVGTAESAISALSVIPIYLIMAAKFSKAMPNGRGEAKTFFGVYSPHIRRTAAIFPFIIPLLFLDAISDALGQITLPSSTQDDQKFFLSLIFFVPLSAALFLWPALRVIFSQFHVRRPTVSVRRPYEWDRAGSAWIWLFLPVLLFPIGTSYSSGPFQVDATALWLPVGAWLGARHGRRGFRLMLAATIVLCVGIGYGGFVFGGDLGIYAASLLLCRLFGSVDYRSDCLGAGRVTLRMLAFLGLSLACAPSYQMTFSGFQITISFALREYFWLLLLVIGLSFAPLPPVLGMLGIAATAGFALSAMEATPRFAGFQIAYWFDGPHHLVTGAVALWTGRLLRQWLQGWVEVRWGELWRPLLAEAQRQRKMMSRVSLGALFVVLLLSGVGVFPTFAPGAHSVPFGTGAAGAMLLFSCAAIGGTSGFWAAVGIWAAACLVPFALVDLSNFAASGPSALGWFQVHSPASFTGLSYSLAPGLRIAPMEPVFAFFGWLVSRHVGKPFRTPNRIAKMPNRIPPPFQYRQADLVLSWLAGIYLLLVAVIAALNR